MPDDPPPPSGIPAPIVQDLARFSLPPGFRGRSPATAELWRLTQDLLFRPSPQFLYGWRRFLLRLFGAQVAAGAQVRPTARIAYPWRLSLGERCWVGDFAELYSLADIRIGADAVVSQQAYLCAATHDLASPAFEIIGRPIVIEDQAWVAAGAFIHPGLTVGRGAVIGARAVLTRDAEPLGIYAGQPARRIGWRAAAS